MLTIDGGKAVTKGEGLVISGDLSPLLEDDSFSQAMAGDQMADLLLLELLLRTGLLLVLRSRGESGASEARKKKSIHKKIPKKAYPNLHLRFSCIS